jgi:cellulose synthase/poly-beta-1,6-N-acetylglucosamine synthase-like glycosyltransferase
MIMENALAALMPVLEAITTIILVYFLAVNTVYLMLSVASYIQISRYRDMERIFKMQGVFSSKLFKPVSIIAPAYNEEASIINSVSSLLGLTYANFEVIVVNDGSKDRTMEVLITHFNLVPDNRPFPAYVAHKPVKQIYTSAKYPRLVVIDKENGRKADALNAGLNLARYDLICAVDADSMLEADVLLKMLRVFMEDDTTVAVGGTIRVANGCKFRNKRVERVLLPGSYLGRIQAVEYLRAFLFGRVGWDYLNSLLIISGAFGIFDRRAVINVGGYLHDTVGEDMELILRLHRYHLDNEIPYRVRFIAEPVCWTEVPEDWKTLSRQRNRWHRGLADTLFRYRSMFFKPKYGRVGSFALPFFLFAELISPVIELGGYLFMAIAWALGAINWTFALLFLAAAIVFGMILSVTALLLEEMTTRRYEKLSDVFIMMGYALLENLGFRQIHAWWRFRGLIDFLRGRKDWGTMVRKGVGG